MSDTKRIRELLAERDLAQSRRDHDQVGLLESFIMDELPGLLDENERLTECEETNSRINADLLTELYALKQEVERLREELDLLEYDSNGAPF